MQAVKTSSAKYVILIPKKGYSVSISSASPTERDMLSSSKTKFICPTGFFLVFFKTAPELLHSSPKKPMETICGLTESRLSTNSETSLFVPRRAIFPSGSDFWERMAGSNLFSSDFNSNSLIHSNASSVNKSTYLASSKEKSTGQSVLIVASSLLKKAKSLFVRKSSLALFGSTCSRLSYAASIVGKAAKIFPAVFSPTPGTPGILSAVSPISPFISITCSGVIPYFSITSAV